MRDRTALETKPCRISTGGPPKFTGVAEDGNFWESASWQCVSCSSGARVCGRFRSIVWCNGSRAASSLLGVEDRPESCHRRDVRSSYSMSRRRSWGTSSWISCVPKDPRCTPIGPHRRRFLLSLSVAAAGSASAKSGDALCPSLCDRIRTSEIGRPMISSSGERAIVAPTSPVAAGERWSPGRAGDALHRRVADRAGELERAPLVLGVPVTGSVRVGASSSASRVRSWKRTPR